MLEHFLICLNRVNKYLKLIGLCLDIDDNKKTMLERMRNHRIYSAHFISFNLELIAQLWWFVDAVMIGKSFLEITYLLPCCTLCLLSTFKSFSFLYYVHYVNNLVESLKNLEPNLTQSEEERYIFAKKLAEKYCSMLLNILNKIECLIVMGLLMFALLPLFIIIPHYYKTGEVKLELPFIGYYPFNETDLRIYPWIYLHQMLSATESLLLIFGPASFFFTCCTYINMQFLLLHYDMEKIVSETSQKYDKSNFRGLAVRHIKLMRCVNLLENIFSKSILFNAVTSSIIICVTGFNVMAIDNIVVMASFTTFLMFGLMQIFLFCYYGDTIMRSSIQVSNAIYNSQWYDIKPTERKSVSFVMIRAQNACKLTAYGYFDLNLYAFTSILSKSWSYFALLQTIYQPE